jgi:predicted metalloprotease
MAAACAAVLAGCGTTVIDGHAVSMMFDPYRVGGLPAADGYSGPRPDAPPPTRSAENADGGAMDQLALLAVDDIEEFWTQSYSSSLPGAFVPVSTLLSYDSNDLVGPSSECGSTVGLVNAFYCPLDDSIAWDRGVFVPVAAKYFGDMGVVGLMAHEYGHAVQWMANLIDESTPTLVKEQQADCFAGVYLRWVAAGNSPRFELSTGDGLNHVLAGAIYIRDPLTTRAGSDPSEAHGSALDRVSTFQMGFSGGADQCAAIDMREIAKRQGDLPQYLGYDSYGDPEAGESAIDADTLAKLMETLGEIYSPANPPTLTTEPVNCPDAQTSAPASYCPDDNTISVDLPALQAIGAAKTEEDEGVLLEGDNTALSIVTSRYALAVQHERALTLDTPTAALRTACLTGVGQAKMAEPDGALVLSAGDTDEAVSGLLTNGLAASGVNGSTVPAGFTRILAYRSGLQGAADQCYERFP